MKKPQLTFAIPFYGTVAYLKATLASLQKQAVSEWLAIVVDDASPDKSARALVESLDDDRISYIRNPTNLGLADNWNRCIDLCRTPLVTLLHADDELLPEYAAIMLAAHARWPSASAIFCGAQTIGPGGELLVSIRDLVKKWLRPKSDEPFTLAGATGVTTLLRGNLIVCPTLCYKRALFDELRFASDWRMVLDLEFYLRALIAGAQIVGIPDVAYRYRRHPDQTTEIFEKNLQRYTEEIQLWRWAASAADRYNWEETAVVARKMTILKLQMVHSILGDMTRLSMRSAGRKITLLRAMVGA